MAARATTSKKTDTSKPKATPGPGTATRSRSNPKVQKVGAIASDVIQTAAGVLEDELAAGIAAARPVAERFSKSLSVDEGELEQVVAHVRKNVHDLVDLIDARMSDLRSEQVQSLSSSLINDAHDITDVLMNLLGAAPALVSRTVGSDRANE